MALTKKLKVKRYGAYQCTGQEKGSFKARKRMKNGDCSASNPGHMPTKEPLCNGQIHQTT